MSEGQADNVVTLPQAPKEAPADPTLENLIEFCQRLEEGMQYIATTLVAMDSRVRRLELAVNKEAREKAKPSILNVNGERVN